MNEWRWHLFNDPMNENPWAVALLLLIMGSWFAAAYVPIWWRYRR